jgi:hypothetical protein
MASELILVLRDFSAIGNAPARDALLPRLPALETLLGRAVRAPLPQGWRDHLRTRFAAAAQLESAPAGVVATDLDLTPAGIGTQYWLATPVHCFAGLDSVQLHPAGLLELSVQTQSALAAEFSSVFADTPWRLHATGKRELLLSGATLAASAADPAMSIGADLRDGLPRGPEAATLRRLGVEIEMWLHENRINRERQSRGELPVSGLWLWGATTQSAPDSGARRPIAPPSRSGPLPQHARLFGEDAYMESLWRLRGSPIAPLPDGFERIGGPAEGSSVVLYPTLGAAGPLRTFEQLEQRWLAPALQALRARRLSSLSLLAGSFAYRLTRWYLARFWRPASPWWEALA